MRAPGRALSPCETTIPSTVTAPRAMSSSASRRLQRPRQARSLDTRWGASFSPEDDADDDEARSRETSAFPGSRPWRQPHPERAWRSPGARARPQRRPREGVPARPRARPATRTSPAARRTAPPASATRRGCAEAQRPDARQYRPSTRPHDRAHLVACFETRSRAARTDHRGLVAFRRVETVGGHDITETRERRREQRGDDGARRARRTTDHPRRRYARIRHNRRRANPL